jgi:hypothetical protein
MSCRDLNTIYAYLEGDLSAAERSDFDRHLARCPQCRNAVEERRVLLQAAATLPPFEVPEDFTAGVMSRLEEAPSRTTVLGWFVATFAGLASFAATLVVAALLTGHSLSEFLLGFNRFLWNNVRNLSFIVTKGLKYLYLAGKILVQVFQRILEGLKVMTSFIGPEAQVVAACAAVLILIGTGVIWRRKFLWERNHHE